jgi:catechol 2,3-dioxygenase-like lactoylglutathione lyase family enzyme
MSVRELRLVLTVEDLDAAVAFYRDALGLEQLGVFENDGGRGFLLGADRGTLELFDEAQAAAVDAIEVGRRAAGPVRIAFEVEDSDVAAERLVAGGGAQLAPPVETPWAIATCASRRPTECSSRSSALRRRKSRFTWPS